MKKLLNLTGVSSGIKKLWVIMRLSAFLILLTVTASATGVYSQNTKLNVKLNDARISDVFDAIEKQSEFFFFYNRDNFDDSRRISVNMEDKKLNEILDEIFAREDVSYEIFDRNILIKKGVVPEKQSGQQNISVSGKVTDLGGQPLPGITIVVKGTTKGVISDADGRYSVSGIEKGSVLLFSFVGMQSQEIVVGDQTEINVVMVESTIGLDEVVAVGYGTMTKRYVSGSISSIDLDKTKELLPNTNIVQSMAQVAGIQVINSGRPGQNGSLLIRGQNSLGTSSSPLIVLDGIIFEGSLSDINSQDIKTIDVLKDAASTAIYGSKAANGVIMITSLKGTSAKPIIRVNSTYGISEAANWLKLQSKEGYIQRRIDYHTQANDQVDVTDVANLLQPDELENYNNGIFTDPFTDLISQQGKLSVVDLSVSGKTDHINYLVSGSFNNDRGLIIGDQEKRTTFRINIDSKINNWLTIGTTSLFSQRDQSGITPSLSNAYRNSPFGNFYYSDGSVKFNPVSTEAASYNCMYDYELTDNDEKRMNLFANLYADITVPFIKGLSFRMNYAPNYEWHNNYTFMRQDPHAVSNNTAASKVYDTAFRWVWENILTYKRSFGENHDLNLTLMYGRNHGEADQTVAEASLFDLDYLGYNNFGLASQHVTNTYYSEKNGVSSMARLNYTLMQKYLISLAVRRDGSSVFGDNNKFGTFPSAAFSWIASDESFMENIKDINLLKFRISYGANGNDAISPYQTKSLNTTTHYVFGDGGSSVIGVVPETVMGNESLKWESTYATNFGLDFGLFKNRLSGSVDLYNKTTKDLIVKRTIPPTNGYETTYDNIGEVNNKGIEFTLNSINIQQAKFQWSSSFTFGYNKNQIVHLFGDVDGDGVEDDDIGNRWFIGEDINSYFDYEFDGIYQETDTDIPANSKPGYVRVKDLSGEGTISADNLDKTIVGHGKHPSYALSLTNTFNYENFSLYIALNSMLGWQAPFNLINPLDLGRAFNTIDAGYWTPENKSTSRPSLTYTNPLGTNWYFSRDFVRIKDLALSYNFKGCKSAVFSGFSSLRLTLSVKNLYTFTKWIGPDPESSGDGTTSNQGSDDLYPMPRTYSVGINMSF